MFPSVGRHVFITSRVTWTIAEFFLSYLVEILAFTLAFHILLRDNTSFHSLADSFMMVIIMLLGELDYSSLIEAPENIWLLKIVFLMFILMMSIVLINLIIGLSISDISTLRYSVCRESVDL